MSLTISVADIIKNSNNPLLAIDPSWERIPLGEIAKILNGFAFKSELFNDTKGMPLIRIRDIGKNRTDCYYNGPFNESYVIKPGDLLIGMDGDFNCSRWTGPNALLNQRVCKIEVNPNLYDHNFLEFVLPGYLKEINENTSSQTVKHLSSRSIAEILLPNPSLSEQHRIVARVEALLSQVNATRERLNRVPLIMKRFRQAVLAAACSGRLTESWREENEGFLQSKQEIPQFKADVDLPISWNWVSPAKIVKQETPHSLAIGPFGSDLKVSDYTSSGVPLIFVRNIRSGIFSDISTKYISSMKAKELAAHKVQSRDVLITKMGDPPGDARIYPENVPDGIITADCIKMSLNPLIANPNYIEYAINSRLVKNQIYSITMGVAQSKISLARFKKIGIPLPPLEEQHEIVRSVNALFTLADKIELQVADATKRTEALIQALLAKAFRGELVEREPELVKAFL